MGDASTITSSVADRLPQITDRASHDAVISRQAQLDNTPILLYVTSSVPACRTLTPQIIAMWQSPEFKDVRFYEMELTSSTTPMIKFGPQNCPLVFLFRGEWCETLLGIRGVEEVERAVRRMLERG